MKANVSLLVIVATLAAGQTTEVRGKELLLRAQRAMGGVTTLASLRDAIQVEEITFEPAAGGGKIKLTRRWIVPNQLRIDMDTSFGKVTTYTDGRSGWTAGPQGVEPMPAAMVTEEAQDELFHELATLMLSDRDASRVVSAVSDNAVRISMASGRSAQVEFDSATGRSARLLFQGHEAATRTRTDVVLAFSDWRTTAGIVMPHRIVQTENGAKTLERMVSEYRFNSALKAEALGRRP